jgi:hypothetical protein
LRVVESSCHVRSGRAGRKVEGELSILNQLGQRKLKKEEC